MLSRLVGIGQSDMEDVLMYSICYIVGVLTGAVITARHMMGE